MSTTHSFLRWLRGWLPKKPGKRVGPTELSKKRVVGLLGVSLVITSLVALSMWNPFASSASSLPKISPFRVMEISTFQPKTDVKC